MGYKIVYSKPTRHKGRGKRLILLISVFFLAFSLRVRLSDPDGFYAVWDWMVADKVNAEMEAFFATVLEMEQGDTVVEAVQTFCQEIFGGA